jgi:hypothetical protein
LPPWGWVNLLLSTPVGSTWRGLSYHSYLSLAVYRSTQTKDRLPRLFTYALAISLNAQQMAIPKQYVKARAKKKKKNTTSPLRQHVARTTLKVVGYYGIKHNQPIEAACSKPTSKVVDYYYNLMNNRSMVVLAR